MQRAWALSSGRDGGGALKCLSVVDVRRMVAAGDGNEAAAWECNESGGTLCVLVHR
jgi:hypothetical protein